jgi:hypothetical protein
MVNKEEEPAVSKADKSKEDKQKKEPLESYPEQEIRRGRSVEEIIANLPTI